jgi:hypothetical protein
LLAILLGPPALYFVVSYAYLVYWHRRLFLWNTVIHENGRLTLAGSLFYFDHFLGCVPMITFFALSAAGGFALGGSLPAGAPRAKTAAIVLLLAAALFLTVTLAASIAKVGWQRTSDYAFQRIERDGVTSKGGNWNQFQVSNIPIFLGTIGLGSAVAVSGPGATARDGPIIAVICLALALLLSIGLSAANWCGWRAFGNPRWLAHSIREVATYPLTGIPIALAAVALTESYLSGAAGYVVTMRPMSLLMIASGVALVLMQLVLLRRVNISSIAQRPAFAPRGLSIPYLLASHVFEHFLDFTFIALVAGGVYSLMRFLTG